MSYEGDEELELIERACRAVAARARRKAERLEGTPNEQVYRSTQARFLRIAERIKEERRATRRV
jgi:hypothetical protein